MPDDLGFMRLDAFVCSDIITTVMFDCFPAIGLGETHKNHFSKKRNDKFRV
jgi:hypothetical protein